MGGVTLQAVEHRAKTRIAPVSFPSPFRNRCFTATFGPPQLCVPRLKRNEPDAQIEGDGASGRR